MKKEQSIESLRGLAILLVTAGHITGENSTQGIEIPEIWQYMYHSLVLIRMPLFTVISGYVYSLRPVIIGKGSEFLKGKARRILYPMIFVGALHFSFQAFVPGVNHPVDIWNIWKVPIFSYAHFWFLQSIFTVFIIVTLIDTYNLMDKMHKWLIIMFIASITYLMIPTSSNIFSIGGTVYLFPYFIFGCGVNRFKLYINFRYLIIALTLLIPGIILQQLNWFKYIDINVSTNSLLALIIGLSSTFFLVYIRKDIPILARLGYYAFGIYLFHVFGTAGSRILFKFFGLSNFSLIFLIGMIFGIAVPITIEIFLEKHKLSRKLFLGMK